MFSGTTIPHPTLYNSASDTTSLHRHEVLLRCALAVERTRLGPSLPFSRYMHRVPRSQRQVLCSWLNRNALKSNATLHPEHTAYQRMGVVLSTDLELSDNNVAQRASISRVVCSSPLQPPPEVLGYDHWRGANSVSLSRLWA